MNILLTSGMCMCPCASSQFQIFYSVSVFILRLFLQQYHVEGSIAMNILPLHQA